MLVLRKQQLQIAKNKKQRQAFASLLTLGQQYSAHWLRCRCCIATLTYIIIQLFRISDYDVVLNHSFIFPMLVEHVALDSSVLFILK